MRRLLLAVAAMAVVAMPTAWAQEGYSGGWNDPAPSGVRDGKPLAYLQQVQRLSGHVSHPNGIASVNAFLVPNLDAPPPSDCEASADPSTATEPSGNGVIFHLTATFPCNLVYEVRANAQANASGGIGGGSPPPHVMPLFVAVAIPPAPVAYVDAELEMVGDAGRVVLSWPGGTEPDLLGYVIARDGEPLGQLDAGETTRFVDPEPPTGGTSRYSVTAVRRGPDDTVPQVSSRPTTVSVDVPATPDDDAAAGGGDGTGAGADPQIAGEATTAETRGAPGSGGLSSVRSRAQAPPRLGPPTTIDTGFDETLPFDTTRAQAAAPTAPPVGDQAVVRVFDEDELLDEKQRLAFLAGGLAVLVGAAVIMHVTRRAAREAAYEPFSPLTGSPSGNARSG